MKFNIWCFLFGHKDWVMTGAGLIPQDRLYELWKHTERQCERCGKQLKPTV